MPSHVAFCISGRCSDAKVMSTVWEPVQQRILDLNSMAYAISCPYHCFRTKHFQFPQAAQFRDSQKFSVRKLGFGLNLFFVCVELVSFHWKMCPKTKHQNLLKTRKFLFFAPNPQNVQFSSPKNCFNPKLKLSMGGKDSKKLLDQCEPFCWLCYNKVAS